jgi:hypothetical protein
MSRYCGNLCHGLEIRPYPHAVLIKVGASWRQLSPGSGEGQSSKNGPERERMSNQRQGLPGHGIHENHSAVKLQKGRSLVWFGP